MQRYSRLNSLYITTFSAQLRKFFKTKEGHLFLFFGACFVIIVLRLFYLEVVQWDYYRDMLVNQHYTKSELRAKRGQIFVTDRSGKHLQLTENVPFFNLYVDPKFVNDKARLIQVLTPIVYKHFCEIYGLQQPTLRQCAENIQEFSRTQLLPQKQGVFIESWGNQYYIDDAAWELRVAEALSGFTQSGAQALIAKRLDEVIKQGLKDKNYLWFFEDKELLEELADTKRFPFLTIENTHYVYIVPDSLGNASQQAVRNLQQTLLKYGQVFDIDYLKALRTPQEIRYVKLMSHMNAKIAQMIRDTKKAYFQEAVRGVPLLHGLWLEEYRTRYYPYGNFMSNILGYMDKENRAHYGVEEYFDTQLRGRDGKIIGLATPWIGQVGANAFEIEQPQDGMDVYLTIDPVIQREGEEIAKRYMNEFNADSVAITILEPETGKITALINYPAFDPNDPSDAYTLKPLTYDQNYLIENLTFIDIPLYYLSGEQLIQAKSDERTLTWYQKYVFENGIGPQVFVDKNISYPFEPGSVFKAFTLGIGMDSDAISMYDYYEDKGFIQIDPFVIKNVDKKCTGTHTYLHALEFSCNVGMVRIAQAITKYVFYTYLERLGFGNPTTIELAGEEAGTLPDFNAVSLARFFNNAFGQGMLVTPMQMAVGYAALVNGGWHIQPTLVSALYDPHKQTIQELATKKRMRVFTQETAIRMKEALLSVIDNGHVKIKIPGFSLWGKTGTAQIAYKGQYQQGAGWTNGSFMGILTAKDTRYVISIQVRRPRLSQWWELTAGKIYQRLAEFLLAYEGIEE
jgi:cell division protein FtsI/penicillin-binding protein 2